jgi:hypothetical protein
MRLVDSRQLVLSEAESSLLPLIMERVMFHFLRPLA